MITKGNLHGAGAKLAAYLMTGKHGEQAELVQTRGLELLGNDPVHAFATAQQIALAATDSTKPFFHTQTRCPAGEELTREQWLEVADRQEKRLGLTGQPRIVSFHHLPDGSAHMHVAWFRIDLETMRAIDPGLYKNHLKELSRTLENELGLTRVRNERAADDRTRAPERGEFEEARRLKTDLKAIRNTILDCIHQSDNGKALNAALGAHGLMLANGDRRDCFVVVDQAGGQHALNKRLTGMTLAEIRARLGDIDRAQLPGVEAGARAATGTRERARGAPAARHCRRVREPRAGATGGQAPGAGANAPGIHERRHTGDTGARAAQPRPHSGQAVRRPGQDRGSRARRPVQFLLAPPNLNRRRSRHTRRRKRKGMWKRGTRATWPPPRGRTRPRAAGRCTRRRPGSRRRICAWRRRLARRRRPRRI